MKYINSKTLILALSAFTVMAFTGCDSKTGIPHDTQLVGSSPLVTPPPEVIPPFPVPKIVLPLCTKDEGSEPWTSDGTTAGTIMLKDINNGAKGTVPRKIGGNDHNSKFVLIGLETFFPAKMLHTDGSETYESAALWKSNGTTEGTVMLKDFNKPFDGEGDGLAQLVVMGGNLYFRGWDEEHAYQIWKSDGTAAGTVRVTNITPNDYPDWYEHQIGGLRAMGDIVFFHASDTGNGPLSLWTTDGTEAGTSKLMITDDSSPGDMKVADGKLYFSAGSGDSGREPWISDGTEAGTHMIADIYSGTPDSRPSHFSDTYNGSVYFQANGNSTSLWGALYKTDGTEEGTVLVKDIVVVSGSSPSPYGFKVFNGVLYFNAYDDNGYALWKTDGTDEGTVKVFGSAWDSLDPEAMQVVNSQLIFRGYDNIEDDDFLYTYDGSATEPTKIVTDENSTYPHNFKVVDDSLWFMIDTGDTIEGGEGYNPQITAFWKTDGTTEGTALIKDGLCPKGGMDGDTGGEGGS